MRSLILLIALLLVSCGGGSKDQNESVSDTNVMTAANNSSSTSCLAEMTDPEKWYSKSDVAKLVGQEEAIINFKSNPQYDNCYFNWKNDRKHVMKVGNFEAEVPTNNVVGITIYNLDDKIERAEKMHKKSFTYEAYFDSYHTTTKAGEEQVKKTLEEKGKEDEKAKTAKGLLDMAPTEGHADVDGLGDKANKYIQTAPGLRETRLSILHGNVVMMINVDISDDDAVDLNTAKEVARGVLGLCN